MKVNARFQDVPARDALHRMLDCMGFSYREDGAALVIVPLEPRQAVPACTDGVQLAN